jgi:hypothetical protein
MFSLTFFSLSLQITGFFNKNKSSEDSSEDPTRESSPDSGFGDRYVYRYRVLTSLLIVLSSMVLQDLSENLRVLVNLVIARQICAGLFATG